MQLMIHMYTKTRNEKPPIGKIAAHSAYDTVCFHGIST